MFPLYLIYMIAHTRLAYALNSFTGTNLEKKEHLVVSHARLAITIFGCVAWLCGLTFATLWELEGTVIIFKNKKKKIIIK